MKAPTLSIIRSFIKSLCFLVLSFIARPSHRLWLYLVVLRRSDPTQAIGFEQKLLGSSNTEASFGLSIRQATPEEVQNYGGYLIVEDILPGSPAALSIMIQVSDVAKGLI